MKHISILVPKGEVVVNCIEGSYKLFTNANDFLNSRGKPSVFKVQLVALSKELHPNNGLFPVMPELVIDEVEKTDLIIIPAILGDLKKNLSLNQGFVPWIRNQYEKGAEVASLCVGAFLLASTGIVNGKKCTTHWMAADEFRTMFPEVELVTEKIITDEDRIYTSGGAYSFLNLILYLVEKFAGRDIAILCSKAFEIEIERTSQSPFIAFHGQKTHNDEEIKKAQDFIERNYEDKLTIEQLALMLALSKRNLERRFKKATVNTVAEYIQRVRIEAAKMKLESSNANVNEVMYKSGYNDHKAFRVSFRKVTGLSPSQYRNRYNRERLN